MKNYYPGMVYEKDTTEFTMEFSSAKLSLYQKLELILISNTGNFSQSVFCKIVNDSTLKAFLPTPDTQKIGSSFKLSLNVIDEHDDFRYLMYNQPINIIRRNFNNQVHISLDSQYRFNNNAPDWVKIGVRGFNTHFLNPETQFAYHRNYFSSASVRQIDSFNIINDTFAYVYLPSPRNHGYVTYAIKFRNYQDGILPYSNGSVIFCNEINPFYDAFVYLQEPLTKNDTNILLTVRLRDTDSFNLDSINRNLKPVIKLTYHNQKNVIAQFSLDTMTFDTFILLGKSSQRSLSFLFKISLPQDLVPDFGDVLFQHPQLEDLWFPDLLAFNNISPEIKFPVANFPGKKFSLEFSDKGHVLDSGQFSISFQQSGQTVTNISTDSIRYFQDHSFILYGRSDSNALGAYDIRILKNSGYSYMLTRCLIVNPQFPFLLKIYSGNKFLPEKIDSSLDIRSEYLPGFFPFGLNQFQILRNQQVVGGIQLILPPANSPLFAGIKIDSGVSSGWYDLKFFDTTDSRYYIQKDFIYVYSTSRAVKISPEKYAVYGVGNKEFTVWFKNTHFIKARDIRITGYSDIQVLNDTLLKMNGRGADPVIFNEVDSFVACTFTRIPQEFPLLTHVSPNWVAPATKVTFTIKADVSTWSLFPNDVDVSFRRDLLYVPDIFVTGNTVLNDTTIVVEAIVSDTVKSGYYQLLVFQRDVYASMLLDSAVRAVPVGLDAISIQKKNQIEVYPVPSNGVLQIKFNESNCRRLQILSVLGELVREIPIREPGLLLNLDDLLPCNGIYLLHFEGEQSQFHKIIYQK
ncbi:MAG: hypothetical protein Q8M15_01245 [Bacteroidota bacterium]|nr:hypothetical protein [Bacteroidota bacterium]